METQYILPAPDFMAFSLFSEKEEMSVTTDALCPTIILSYKDFKTEFMINLMIDLAVTRKDLFLVNFSKVNNKINALVCFKIKRFDRIVVLLGETDIDEIEARQFLKNFERRQKFIITFGLYRSDDVISLAEYWHIVCDSFTEYDGENLMRYLCGRYE
jgi:hypothetical protein